VYPTALARAAFSFPFNSSLIPATSYLNNKIILAHMPLILNKDEFNHQRVFFTKKLKDSVFIYPTDTIYGIGCDATNPALVKRVRALKKSDKPFSVIAPSRAWVEENCKVTPLAKDWFAKLPGPYTLIIRLKNKKAVAGNVNPGKDTLGIRVPDNWFSDIVKAMDVPVVTTSANVTGENFMTCLDDLSFELKAGVDIIITDGTIKGRPSTLVTIDDDTGKITERKGPHSTR
jgi:L-threonylcarbamoyladenylate synthase